MKQTWHIHIEGQVQGVGFRPFVYQKAMQLALKGWVNNAIDGVHCEFNASKNTARSFYKLLISDAPALANITTHNLQSAESKSFDTFNIVHSSSQGPANLLLTPDFAMCNACRNELFTESNRRHGYPFITCTNCGPRYSIIEKLPYDRDTTTMEKFPMCKKCKMEYENPLDRRYYSQTNSCAACGMVLSLYNANQKLLTSNSHEIIARITKLWNEGKIVAIKGIGGYLITCDAVNKVAIKTLRRRKQRPTKPLALMYPDAETLKKDLVLGAKEIKMLRNPVSPIMLVDVKNISSSANRHPVSGIRGLPSGICLSEIAPGLSRLGVMVPYTPLYALLLASFGRPIIATSGNITHSPIIYDDKKALNELTSIADYVLANNRGIAVPQDDSVTSFTPQYSQKIVYRRSRGMAPSYINPKLTLPGETILATGANLKSTFTYLHRQNIFISQYLGDLDHFETQQNYRQTVAHFFDLFGDQPAIILADKHPDYFSTRFAGQCADELDVSVKKYQHHKAHFGAILGEHALLDSAEPILGVIWDGTGLGDDGNIWGGEFFLYEKYKFDRCAHFDYLDFIAGDKMPQEPRISALAAIYGAEGPGRILRNKFSDLEWKNYHILLQKQGNLKTSSVGRLFDAVSSLLGLKDRSHYEGEAAMLLETEARKFVEQRGLSFSRSYFSEKPTNQFSTASIIQGVIGDIDNGKDTAAIAARFHYSLVEAIAVIASQQGTGKIAFSGGVFQNALLVDLILHYLGNYFDLYFHRNLSPNDENISFGQLMCYIAESRRKK